MKKRIIATAVFMAALISVSVFYQGIGKAREADIKIASLHALDSKANRLIGKERVVRPDEPDFVSEQVAQSLISQLANWEGNGKGLAEDLQECSAIHAAYMLGNKSSCFHEYSGEAEEGCLVKRGYGRKSVGQALTADRMDLNDDGILDYIISDRYYCPRLSANQSNVYFVMLSSGKNNFRLSYADWASYGLNVVQDPTSGAKILVEKAPKLYGTYTRIMHLVEGKFVPRVCIFQNEQGYSECEKK
jgi:hypothetical protein